MSEFYGEQHRSMQETFETRKLADCVRENVVASEIADEHKGFIEARDMFFLTTIDHRGYPTCSYKGGNPGFIKVIDQNTLAFPSYDGNGMFLSMGNITANAKIGMLFIDFETPDRLRVHGTASVTRSEPLIEDFHGADLIVRVSVIEIFVNCPRYIHRYRRIATSRYVPEVGRTAPLPQWKRIDGLQDVLRERDKTIAAALGAITPRNMARWLRKVKPEVSAAAQDEKLQMTPATAATVCSVVLTVVVLLVMQKIDSVPLWPLFIAWACFFHLGGASTPGSSVTATFSTATFGVFVGWLSAIAILTNPVEGSIPSSLYAAVVIGIAIGAITLAARWQWFSITPVCIYGYAANWGYLDVPGRLDLSVLTSFDLDNVILALPVAIGLGCVFGYLNSKLVSQLVSRQSVAD